MLRLVWMKRGFTSSLDTVEQTSFSSGKYGWIQMSFTYIYTGIYLEKSGSGPVAPVQNCLSSVFKVDIKLISEDSTIPKYYMHSIKI